MLAVAGALPRDDEGWAFEMKWDGVRALAYLEGGQLRLAARSGRDITVAYPELAALGPAAGSALLLDGRSWRLRTGGRVSLSSSSACTSPRRRRRPGLSGRSDCVEITWRPYGGSVK